MPISELLTLTALVAVIIYWLLAMKAKETARYLGRQRCQCLGLTFLDDTVVLKKLRLVRNEAGQRVIRRQYQFEFSSDGSQRYRGQIILSDNRLEAIVMDAYRLPAQSTDD